MARPSKYPRELKERAVRLVFESKDEYPSEFQAIRAIAGKLPATGPTDRPLPSGAVLGRLAGTGFVKGLRR